MRVIGGFVANLIGFGTRREGGDVVNIQSISVAIVGAVIVVVVVGLSRAGVDRAAARPSHAVGSAGQ